MTVDQHGSRSRPPFVDRVASELRSGLDVYAALGFTQQQLVGDVIADLRARAVAVLGAAAPPSRSDVDRQELQAPGLDGDPNIPMRVYRPSADAPRPGVYWIHSGGMMLGSAAQDDRSCEHLARTLGCTVVSVDYRLAPEHPDPAPRNDCYAGLLWMDAHAEELGIDRGRVAISGGSAGGGLAAGVTLMARDLGGPRLIGQILTAPMLDDRDQTSSAAEFAGVVSWSREHNRSGWRALLGARVGTDAVSVYSAPARAADLAGLPPAVIQVGELEVFRDEDVDYALRLLQAGVPVQLHVLPGVYHGSESLVPDAPVSRRALDERIAALRGWFAD